MKAEIYCAPMVPDTRPLDATVDGRAMVELQEPFHVISHGELHTILPGFKADGASSPRVGWSLIPPNDPLYAPAALMHDAFYSMQVYPRDYCDYAFLEMLRTRGVARWRRMLMYASVRVFGQRHYERPRVAIDYDRRYYSGYPTATYPMHPDPRRKQ